MSTFTVLAVIFCWGIQPWAWAALLFCLLMGAFGQFAALKRCRRFGRWLFPALLAILWIAMEFILPHTVNYAQVYALWAMAATIFCFLGAVLGSAVWLLLRAVRRKKQSAE